MVVITPPAVSIPNEMGVTSNKSKSFVTSFSPPSYFDNIEP